jgi:anti-sigma regulatory factor (Ser/Thr protein kinase)
MIVPTAPPFHHEALLHAGDDGYLSGAVPFVRDGLAQGEPVLVATTPHRIDLLREALGPDDAAVRYTDMTEAGRNPARIIPAWAAFLAERRPGTRARGIGEPIWPERTEAELVECQLHESLLNLAFADARGFRLLCPYDTTGLDERVLHEARCSHPVVTELGVPGPSRRYRGTAAVSAPFEAPLPSPPGHRELLAFDQDALSDVRALTSRCARAAGLPEPRAQDLVLAVNELATNSVRHGGGLGVLVAWDELGEAVCEVRDQGRLRDPMAGRSRPEPSEFGGWGLWIANQTCDLVQVRSGAGGTVVRVRMGTAAPVPASH